MRGEGAGVSGVSCRITDTSNTLASCYKLACGSVGSCSVVAMLLVYRGFLFL